MLRAAAAIGPLDVELVESARAHKRATSASPHHHVATPGISSGSSKQRLAQARQKRHEHRRFDQAAAQRVGDRHVAGVRRVHQAGHAERRFVRQLERIALVAVRPPHEHVDRQQPAQRLHEHLVVAHGQVAGLDERVAEVAGQVGVFKIAVPARFLREEHDPRIAMVLRRDAAPVPRGLRRNTARAAGPGSAETLRAASATAPADSRARSRRRTALREWSASTHQWPSGERVRSAA